MLRIAILNVTPLNSNVKHDLHENAKRFSYAGYVSVKQKKNVQIGVRVPDTLKAEVERQAAKQNRTASDWVRLLIEDRLQANWEPSELRDPTPAEEAGEWLLTLPPEIRDWVFRTGEALRLHGPAALPTRLRKVLDTPAVKGKKRKGTS